MLTQNNKNLLSRIELSEKKSAERENELLRKLAQVNEERRKAESKNSKKLDQLLRFAEQCNNPQKTIEQAKKHEDSAYGKLNYNDSSVVVPLQQEKGRQSLVSDPSPHNAALLLGQAGRNSYNTSSYDVSNPTGIE